MTYGDSKILAPFVPGRISIGKYTLEVLPLHAKPHQTLTNTIYNNIVHRKLGHPLKNILWHTCKHIKNLPDIEISNEVSIYPCYAMDKLPNRSFLPNQWCTTHAFELIHSDLKSFPIESYHCHKYIISFVDGFTSMAWTMPLCTNNAALVLTRHFLKMVSTQFNAKVQDWMSNGGGEYKSRAFDDLLKEEGIHIFQSIPHTQQNSRAEQFMHTVMYKSEAMWHDAYIPDSWWRFTFTHATYVYNCTPLQCHNWHTPYEMLHKQQTDIAHLWVFECAAYVHIPEDVRTNKMTPKSKLMVYLGVAPENTSNFLFMWSPNNILFTSAHTLFDELCYPHCISSYMHPIAQPVPLSTGEHMPIRPMPSIYDDHLPNWSTTQAPLSPPIPPPCMPSPCPGIPLPLTPCKLRPGAPSEIPPALMHPTCTHHVPKWPNNGYRDKYPVEQVEEIEYTKCWCDIIQEPDPSRQIPGEPASQMPGDFPNTSASPAPTVTIGNFSQWT